eukprot:scaffold560_cov139-Skeletonema_menzelii.AAC.3
MIPFEEFKLRSSKQQSKERSLQTTLGKEVSQEAVDCGHPVGRRPAVSTDFSIIDFVITLLSKLVNYVLLIACLKCRSRRYNLKRRLSNVSTA